MKNFLIKTVLATMLSSIATFSAMAQYTTLNAHSHNDYKNDIPFWLAYYNHFGSVEADIWAVGDDLFVAHDKDEITPDRSLDILYIQPIVKLVRHNGGRPWFDYPNTFQLIIELKTDVEPTLSMLVKLLEKYPDVFNPAINKNAIGIVITGNVPDPSYFCNYPDYITYDGDINQKYDMNQLKRVNLFSCNLEDYTLWRGEGPIPQADSIKVRKIIESVHAMNKKVRFWGAPDNENAWRTLMNLGVDYVNTDHINELAHYLNVKEIKK